MGDLTTRNFYNNMRYKILNRLSISKERLHVIILDCLMFMNVYAY